MEKESELGNKRIALYRLEWALERAFAGVRSLDLSEDGETVTVTFNSGYRKKVDVACDSVLAMFRDVIGALL